MDISKPLSLANSDRIKIIGIESRSKVTVLLRNGILLVSITHNKVH